MKATRAQAILARLCIDMKEAYAENESVYLAMCNGLCPCDFGTDCANVTAEDWAVVDKHEEEVS